MFNIGINFIVFLLPAELVCVARSLYMMNQRQRARMEPFTTTPTETHTAGLRAGSPMVAEASVPHLTTGEPRRRRHMTSSQQSTLYMIRH